jgi:hypothetical protein
MYDAYLSVGTKPTAGNVDTVEEGVQEESLTSFLLATLSAAKTIEPVVQEEVETVEEEINNSADYINAYANPAPVKDLEEEIVEDEIVEEEVIEDEIVEEEVIEEEIVEDEIVEEEVVEEETEDLGAFILDTIKSQVVKEVTPEEAIAELQAIEEEDEEEDEAVVDVEEEEVEEEEEESLGDFIRRTIAKEAKSAIIDTEAHFEEEINDIFENVKNKKDRKEKLAKVNKEKKEAITAIEERKGETITETLLQLELADKDAEDNDDEEGVEFKGGKSALKKELEKSIKAMFLEEQIKLRKQIELTSGGGGGIGGGTSTLQTNNISDYRCDLNVFFYSGWLQDGSTIFIQRTDGDDEQFATGLTDLESDWANRLNLNYV